MLKPYKYNANNQLTQVWDETGPSPVMISARTYDLGGNLTNDGAHAYSYDSLGRMTAVDSTQYRYDLHDNAVRIGGRELYYHGGKVVYEKSGSGPVLYLAGVNGRVEGRTANTSLKINFIDGLGDISGEYFAGNQNSVGGGYGGTSPEVMTKNDYYMDSAGQYMVTDQAWSRNEYTYLPFEYSSTPNSQAAYGTAPAAGGYGYRGYFYDGSSGFYRVGARWYDSSVGSWTQEDPARADGNFYAYCGGDPVNRWDPSGLCWTYNVPTGYGAIGEDWFYHTGPWLQYYDCDEPVVRNHNQGDSWTSCGYTTMVCLCDKEIERRNRINEAAGKKEDTITLHTRNNSKGAIWLLDENAFGHSAIAIDVGDAWYYVSFEQFGWNVYSTYPPGVAPNCEFIQGLISKKYMRSDGFIDVNAAKLEYKFTTITNLPKYTKQYAIKGDFTHKSLSMALNYYWDPPIYWFTSTHCAWYSLFILMQDANIDAMARIAGYLGLFSDNGFTIIPKNITQKTLNDLFR